MQKEAHILYLLQVQLRHEPQVHLAFGPEGSDFVGWHFGIVEEVVERRECGAGWLSDDPVGLEIVDKALSILSVGTFAKVPWIPIRLQSP